MFLRLCDTDNGCYMKSACRAEMKKAITYTVDVKLSAAGDVEEAQCECGAGMSPTATVSMSVQCCMAASSSTKVVR